MDKLLKVYVKPVAEIVTFDVKDVVLSSPDPLEGLNIPNPNGWH